MINKKNVPFYFAALVAFICLKAYHRMAGVDEFALFIFPVSKIIEFLTGAEASYIIGEGYYFQSLDVLINKSCSGFNFCLISFLLFTFLFVSHFEKPIKKVGALLSSILLSYVLTVVVNASRIYALIVLQDMRVSFFIADQDILHQCVGIITYLTFLVLTYLAIERFLNKRTNSHAKFT